MIEFIINKIYSHPHDKEKSENDIKTIVKRTIVDGKFDLKLVQTELQKNFSFEDNQIRFVLSIIQAVNEIIPSMNDDKTFKKFIKKLVKSKEKVGVCSFTTNKDNKPMWSLYADVYKGYCIEYATPSRKSVMENLCPVIYTKEFENSIFKTLIEYSI